MQKKMIFGILAAIVLSALLFTSLNFYNNINNQKTPQPINGVIDLTDIKNKSYFLINDWEYYPDKIYSPQDFADGRPEGYTEYVSIGERTSANEDEAFGKGTYRLTILLPDAVKTYSLYSPEIYSASRIYINGVQALDMGSVEDNIKEVQSRAVYFDTKSKAEIIINISAFDHYYSGMVYAPAFGIAKNINEFRGANIFIMIFLFNIALICFLMILYTGLIMKQKSISPTIFISGALSLYLLFPILHIFFSATSNLPYVLEIGSLYLVYVFAALHYGNLCRVNIYIKRAAVAIAAAMCILAVSAVLFSPFIGVSGRRLISHGIMMYKWTFAAYVFATSLYSAYTNEESSPLLIFGSVFFGASLVFDRIYSNYDPIYGGKFIELGVLVLLTSLFCILWNDISHSFKFKILAEETQKNYKKQLDIHKLNYEMLTESIEASRKIRHDMRQHLRVIRGYAADNLTDEIENYIDTLETDYNKFSVQVFSKNFGVNALLQYYAQLCKKNNITFSTAFNTTESTSFPDTDITVILGNLLENAVEACINQTSGSKTINVKGHLTEDVFTLYVSNTYTKKPVASGSSFISSKTGTDGIGLKSVQYMVNKYHGILDISYQNNVFEVSLNIGL